MIHPFDHLLVLGLAVLFPIRAATFGYRRLRDAPADEVPRRRLALYRQIIRAQWALALVVVLLWLWQRRPWAVSGSRSTRAPGCSTPLASSPRW